MKLDDIEVDCELPTHMGLSLARALMHKSWAEGCSGEQYTALVCVKALKHIKIVISKGKYKMYFTPVPSTYSPLR